MARQQTRGEMLKQLEHLSEEEVLAVDIAYKECVQVVRACPFKEANHKHGRSRGIQLVCSSAKPCKECSESLAIMSLIKKVIRNDKVLRKVK